MGKDDELPDLPSWEDLGISPEELAELEKELEESGGGEPEEDLLAGLDLSPTPPGPTPPPKGAGSEAPASSPTSKADGASQSKAPQKPSKPQPAAKPGPGPQTKSSGESKPQSESKPKSDSKPKSEPKPKTELKSKSKKHGGFFGRFKRGAKRGAGAGGAGAGAAAGAGSGGSAGGGGGGEGSGDGGAATPAAPRYRALVTVLLLAGLSWAASWNRASPRPVPATAADSVFSSERAFGHLEQIARAAHPPGSPEHTRVRNYIVDQLRAMGLEPQLQTTTHVNQGFTRVVTATVRNVLARIPGSASTGAVLITAHYDGREVAFGAGDDGTGVAAILESVRAIQAGPQLQNDIIVLITDAEEIGLMGARAFVDQHPWIDQVKMVLSIEMRGAGGPSIMFETGQQNGWVVQEYGAASPAPTTNSLSFEVYKRLPNDTDFSPFRDIGKQGLNFAAIGRAHMYHQQYDNIENLSERTVQHHGVQALAMLRHFGGADLSGTLQAPDRVHFALPILGVVTYGAWVSTALSALILLLLVVGFVLAKRQGARPAGMGVGVLFGVLLIVAAAGVGYALASWLPRFHVETGSLHGSRFHSEGWYVLSLFGAVVTLAFAGLALAKRSFSLSELTVGAAVVPALAAIASGPFVAMAAMNFQWPVLAALLAGFVVAGVGKSERVGSVTWVLLLVLAVPVIAFMAPLVELLWLAMNISLAPVLGGLMAMSVLLLLPLVDVARERNGWIATGGALLAGAIALGIGLSLSRPSESRPEPSTLIYAVDHETGASFLATDIEALPDAEAGTQTELRPGLAWAVERTGPLTDETSLQPYFGGRLTVASASAPMPQIAPLQIAMAASADSIGALAPGSTTHVRVRSGVGAELLYFLMPESGARIVAVNGQPLASASEARVVQHWGEPDGGAVDLEIRVPQNGPVEFAVVEHLFRPAELVGAATFARPPELAPNINRASDRAVLRTAVSIDPATATLSLLGGGEASAPPVAAEAEQATDTATANVVTTEVAEVTDESGAPLTVSLFARDQVSSAAPEFATSFSPDGRTAYFNRTDPTRTSFELLATILTSDGWSAPESVPFVFGGLDIDPFVTPDGNRIYFASDRPREGAPPGSASVWYVDRTPTGWSEPIDPGPPINSDSSDIFVSTATDGTLVFSSTRDGARRIYETRETADGWAPARLVSFGSVQDGSNPMISPDGSFMIFAMDGPLGGADLFVSCRGTDRSWGPPRVLGEPINSAFTEFAPGLHPDGTLYFTSERPGIMGPVPEGVRPPGDIYRTDGRFDPGCGAGAP